MARFVLAPPRAEPLPSRSERLRSFFFRRWLGRIVMGALVLCLADWLGAPIPGPLGSIAEAILTVFGVYVAFRAFRFALRRLLWKIRTKLILSYAFIAFVPVLLLTLFFLLAGTLGLGVFSSHIVSSEIERIGGELRATARVALQGLPADDAAAASAVRQRLSAANTLHPRLTFSFARRGRVLASSGPTVPTQLPTWWKSAEFGGLVQLEPGTADARKSVPGAPATPEPAPTPKPAAAGRPDAARDSNDDDDQDAHGAVEPAPAEVLRVGCQTSDAFVFLDAPVDAELFLPLERRFGIRLISTGGTVRSDDEGLEIRVSGSGRRRLERTGPDPEPAPGVNFFATTERWDWATGKSTTEALTFKYPWNFLTRLSPGSLNTADILVKVLGVVGVIFLVMYGVALLIGLLLARSVTRSVHSLHQGTLRLRQQQFDHRIRVTSRDQLGELAESFNQMAGGVQRLLLEQAEKERMEEELRVARQIQMQLLPQPVQFAGVGIAALCRPANEVGGDYYDLLPLSETRMGVLVADVSGKGTSAALYMAELKGLVLSLARHHASPAELLREANRILWDSLPSGLFITMTYAVVDTGRRTMRYARAGHNPIIRCTAAATSSEVLKPQGIGLGLDAGEAFGRVLEEAEVPLLPGDLLVLFTDGIPEAMNEAEEMFGEERLRRLVEDAQRAGSTPIALQDHILDEIGRFVGGASQHDDMTMVILKVA